MDAAGHSGGGGGERGARPAWLAAPGISIGQSERQVCLWRKASLLVEEASGAALIATFH
jgi:hypothetical protein